MLNLPLNMYFYDLGWHCNPSQTVSATKSGVGFKNLKPPLQLQNIDDIRWRLWQCIEEAHTTSFRVEGLSSICSATVGHQASARYRQRGWISVLLLYNKSQQIKQLKTTRIHYLTVSVGQESRHSLVQSSVQGLTRLQSRCQTSSFSAGCLNGKQSASELIRVVGRRPPSGPRGCS